MGTFIGITPTIPLHTGLIILLSFPFRASKISSLIASVVVSNPFTFFLQYYLSWYVGNSIFPGTLSREKLDVVSQLVSAEAGFMIIMNALGKLGATALSVLILGGIILAIPFTISFYFLSLKFFRKIEVKRVARLARQGDHD